MSTARKRAKAKRRSKMVKKGAYSGDNVRIGNLRKEARDRAEVLSKEKLLALRVPIEEEK